jgi:hypothetical protein
MTGPGRQSSVVHRCCRPQRSKDDETGWIWFNFQGCHILVGKLFMWMSNQTDLISMGSNMAMQTSDAAWRQTKLRPGNCEKKIAILLWRILGCWRSNVQRGWFDYRSKALKLQRNETGFRK